MINKIGIRAHDYGKREAEELFSLISQDGYKTIQLALKKAFVDADDLIAVLNQDYALVISQKLKIYDIRVSVLGAYLNYVGRDINQRESNMTILKKHFKIANTLGCRVVGTETGSLNDNYTPHEDNHSEEAYLLFKDVVEEALVSAQEYDTVFAVEAVSHHIIHSPKSMCRLISEVNHERLKVIFDISNLMTMENWKDQDDIMRNAFRLLGEHIVVVHMKDFDFVNGEKVILPLGEGKLNIDLLMSLVKKSQASIDVLGENVPVEKLKSTYALLEQYA